MRAGLALATSLLPAALACHAAGEHSGAPFDIAALGARCGIRNLQAHVAKRSAELWLDEPRVSGAIGGSWDPRQAPTTARQREVESALSCLRREAAGHGLSVEYPAIQVD